MTTPERRDLPNSPKPRRPPPSDTLMWLDVRPDHPAAICSTRRGEVTEEVLVGFAESAPGGIRVFLALCCPETVYGTVGASLDAARGRTRPEMVLILGMMASRSRSTIAAWISLVLPVSALPVRNRRSCLWALSSSLDRFRSRFDWAFSPIPGSVSGRKFGFGGQSVTSCHMSGSTDPRKQGFFMRHLSRPEVVGVTLSGS